MIGLINPADVLAMLSPDAGDLGEGTDVADTLKHKRRSEHYPQLLADIREHGITVPVVIDYSGRWPELLEGHHRVAAAVDLGLPVIPWSSVPLRIDT